jgi:hypothetical protein
MHICCKWRRILFTYQRPLQLRLFCTHATPVLKILDCWPTMPIVVQYGGSPSLNPPAPEDEDNIVAALKRSDRVTSINLTVTNSLLEKLSAIEGPFSELEDLILLSRDRMRLTLPNAFQWCPRLRFLHSTGTVFPALLQLLYSSKNLVDIQLHEVIHPSHFPPEALTNALCGLVQLQSLSLHFRPTAIRHTVSPPPGELVVLPALTRLNFLGRTEYLERLVAGIGAPLLEDIEVTFFDNSDFRLPELRKFTDRIETHESHNRADILASELSISISLTQPTCLTFKLLREPLWEQLFFMLQICVNFSTLFFNVEELLISVARQEDRFNSGLWLESLNSFTGVKWFCVVGNLWTDILRALLPSDTRREAMLPALHKLYIPRPAPFHAPFMMDVVSLITSRRLSGHFVAVEYEQRGAGTVYNQCQDHCIR